MENGHFSKSWLFSHEKWWIFPWQNVSSPEGNPNKIYGDSEFRPVRLFVDKRFWRRKRFRSSADQLIAAVQALGVQALGDFTAVELSMIVSCFLLLILVSCCCCCSSSFPFELFLFLLSQHCMPNGVTLSNSPDGPARC